MNIGLKSHYVVCVYLKFSANLEDPHFGLILSLKLGILATLSPKISTKMLKIGIKNYLTKIVLVCLCLSQIFSQFGRPTFWTHFGHNIEHFCYFEPKN